MRNGARARTVVEMKERWTRWRDRVEGHPGVVDALLALVAAVPVVGGLVLLRVADADEVPFGYPPWWVWVLAGVTVAAVAVRRRWPLQASVVGLAAYVGVVAAATTEPGSVFAAAVLGHTLGCHVAVDRRRRAVVALSVLGVAGMVAAGIGGVFTLNPLIPVAAFFRGSAVRNRRAWVGELEARVAAADELAEEQARQAVAEERARIARELHDVVAHGMSVMVVQAAAASRVMDRRPDQAAQALAAIEGTGRESLTEMRRLLGVLKASSGDDWPAAAADLAPQPGVADLASLARSVSDAGVPVEVRVDLDEALPAGLDLTVHRIVQESLTNVLKHGGRASAVVHVRRAGTSVLVEVVDDGRGAAAPAVEGGGHGLIGMRERVALYGGTLEAGPVPSGGFRVRADLPLPTERPSPATEGA